MGPVLTRSHLPTHLASPADGRNRKTANAANRNEYFHMLLLAILRSSLARPRKSIVSGHALPFPPICKRNSNTRRLKWVRRSNPSGREKEGSKVQQLTGNSVGVSETKATSVESVLGINTCLSAACCCTRKRKEETMHTTPDATTN
uniref:Uncharacterized protein n=1 Tax=Anopheles atroparvus TaxID=41427 RepID=A0A182J282_ANOAO